MKTKNLFPFTLSCILLCSCAESKKFNINGKDVVVEPYGWANSDPIKNDSINYEMSAGNVVLSIIFCETVVVPIYLTGWQIYEPVSKKDAVRVRDSSENPFLRDEKKIEVDSPTTFRGNAQMK